MRNNQLASPIRGSPLRPVIAKSYVDEGKNVKVNIVVVEQPILEL